MFGLQNDQIECTGFVTFKIAVNGLFLLELPVRLDCCSNRRAPIS